MKTFTDEMNERLTELVGINQDAIESNSRKPDANTARKDAWNSIAEDLNQEFGDVNVTGVQCAQKWSKLKSSAKQKAQDKKR